MPQARNRATPIVAIFAVAVALAAADVLALVVVVMNLSGPGLNLTNPGIVPRLVDALGYTHFRAPVYVWFLAFGPLLAGLVVALLVGRRGDGAAVVAPAAEPAAPPPPSPVSALRLLALLQQEGRLIDFLEEDIASYGDAQVGAAVRAIHGGCRNALHERMKIERIYAEEDGADGRSRTRIRSRHGAADRQRARQPTLPRHPAARRLARLAGRPADERGSRSDHPRPGGGGACLA